MPIARPLQVLVPRLLALLLVLGYAAPAAAATGDHVFSQGWQAQGFSAPDGTGGTLLSAVYIGTVDFGGGAFTSTNFFLGDLALGRVDADGAHVWSRNFVPSFGVTVQAMCGEPSGGMFVGGSMITGTLDLGDGIVLSGNSDGWIARFAPNGDLVWASTFGNITLASLSVSGNRLAVVGENFGTVDLGGAVLTASGAGDVVAGVLDLDGNHVWSAQWGDAEYQYGLGGGLDAAGNFTMWWGGRGTLDFGGGSLVAGTDPQVGFASFDGAGAHRYSEVFVGGFSPSGAAVIVRGDVAADGRFAMAGRLFGTADFGGGSLVSTGLADPYVVVFDANGQHVFSDVFASSWDLPFLHAESVSFDGDGNLAYAGSVYGSLDFGGGSVQGPGENDLFLALFDASGTHLFSTAFGTTGFEGFARVGFHPDGSLLYWGSAQAGIDLGGGGLTPASYFVGRLEGLGSATAVVPSNPRVSRVLPAFPNPFNPRTTIRFELASAGPAIVDVYDARGRRVRSLNAGWKAAGEHGVVWDGTDGRGRLVASGVYSYRLRGVESAMGRSVVVVR